VPKLLFVGVALALWASLIGASLAALSLLIPALTPRRVEVAREYLRPRALGLGTFHALGLLFLLSRSEGKPLVGLLGILWLALAMLCLMLGLSALVQQLGFLLFPEQNRLRRALGSAMVVGWACAFPYLGQALGVALLVGAYAAGLAGWTRKPAALPEGVPDSSSAPPPATADEVDQR